jgi:thiol-disulfide isomerase/thioredoxin
MCNCNQELDELLKEHNTRLVTTMFRTPNVVVPQTEKIDSKKPGKPFVVLASYCPFCGEEHV